MDTSGPAFPTANVVINGESATDGVETYGPGMTLREYFASQADVSVYQPVDTLTSKLQRKPTVGELAQYIADIRFIEADAMIARGKVVADGEVES